MSPLLVTGLAVLVLLILILRFKIPAFAALIAVSLVAALAAGMDWDSATDTVVRGMGGTLGFIAVIIGLGALFGTLLEVSGGLERLARRLAGSRLSGPGLGFVGLVAAIPVFFDVALLILAPVALALSRKVKRPVMLYGLPLLVGLATAHAFIPPTPGPVAIADILGVELGWVIFVGAVCGLPAFLLAGPVLVSTLSRLNWLPERIADDNADGFHAHDREQLSGGLVILLILQPLGLILAGTLATMLLEPGPLRDVMRIAGHPFVALMIACGLAAVAVSGLGEEVRTRMASGMVRALEPTGAVILVTGAGGAFKQVLVDTGGGEQLAQWALGLGILPVMAGFLLALLVRVAQGSATVAMITAAGLIAPVADTAGLGNWDLACLAIAIAAGASALSHVNDSGFWLVSRVFGLNEAQTLRSWTLATGVLGISGLASALTLSALF